MGGVSFFNCLRVRPCGLISLQITQSRRCPLETGILARTVLTTPTCATAIPSRILSLVHVAHAKDRNGLRAAIISSRLSRLTYLSLVGRNG
jgi:hypothetical protein